MKIALVGGSFDPPHLAHTQVLQHLLDSNRYDEIWIVPTTQNPFKTIQASLAHRINMCHLAFDKSGPSVKILEDEKHLTGYTIDLMKYLVQKYPDYQFTFVGGSDLKEEIKKWKDFDQLKKYLNFEFLPRPPDPASPFLPIRSIEIRDRLKNQLSIHTFVSKDVEDYIQGYHLYSEEIKK
jgi:nicotinate-nucleotide adenylyltransferase